MISVLRPLKKLLYEAVRDHLNTMLATQSESTSAIPAYAEEGTAALSPNMASSRQSVLENDC